MKKKRHPLGRMSTGAIVLLAGFFVTLGWLGCGSDEEEGSDGTPRVASRPVEATGPGSQAVRAATAAKNLAPNIPSDVQPIAPLGVAVAEKMSDGQIWERYSNGLAYQVLRPAKAGESNARVGQSVRVRYVGTLPNGKEFDRNLTEAGLPFVVGKIGPGGVIAGWNQIVTTMKPRQKMRVWIPSELAYGKSGAQDRIGPNQDLIFEMELVEVTGKAVEFPPAETAPSTFPSSPTEGPMVPPEEPTAATQGAR